MIVSDPTEAISIWRWSIYGGGRLEKFYCICCYMYPIYIYLYIYWIWAIYIGYIYWIYIYIQYIHILDMGANIKVEKPWLVSCLNHMISHKQYLLVYSHNWSYIWLCIGLRLQVQVHTLRHWNESRNYAFSLCYMA